VETCWSGNVSSKNSGNFCTVALWTPVPSSEANVHEQQRENEVRDGPFRRKLTLGATVPLHWIYDQESSTQVNGLDESIAFSRVHWTLLPPASERCVTSDPRQEWPNGLHLAARLRQTRMLLVVTDCRCTSGCKGWQGRNARTLQRRQRDEDVSWVEERVRMAFRKDYKEMAKYLPGKCIGARLDIRRQ